VPSGTHTFVDPDACQVGIAGAKVNLVFTGRGDFKARLTRAELPNLRLLRAEENLPRIAYVTLAPELAFVAFPIHCDPPPIWGGLELQAGNVVFHSRGEGIHQRTRGPSQWALVSLTPEHLAVHGKVLTGQDLAPPPVGRVLRPPAFATAHLRRLHAEACRLAETKPHVLAHREVARALEHDLLHALVECLTTDAGRDGAAARRRHATTMARFEEALAARSGRQPHMPELCDEPEPISAAAAIEPGARRAAAGRPRDRDGRAARAALRVLRARPLRRVLPGDVRRDAVDHPVARRGW
jgi:hypothetical protein